MKLKKIDCKISDATDEMESEHLLSPGRVKSEMFVYAEQGGGGKPVEVQGGGTGGAQVAKRPHFSRRWHNRSDVLLSPSRYDVVKFSEYLSRTD